MTLILLATLLLTLTACNFAEKNQLPTLPPTPTVLRVVAQVTPVPTVNRTGQQVATAAPETESTSEPEPAVTVTDTPGCTDDSTQAGTTHTVKATLDYWQQSLAVEQTIRYINRTDAPLTTLVLDVEPNRSPSIFTLGLLTLDDGVTPGFELEGRRLDITLPEALGQGCKVDMHFAFDLRIPQIGAGADGYHGYFGFSARQINLARWMPIMAVRQGSAWLLHDNSNFGEQSVADWADWDVTLTVNGATEQLQVVAPGEATQPEANTWRFVHSDARDFALSMSEHFHKREQVAENGVVVELWTLNEATNGADHALSVAARSMAMYSDLFGAYPHERMVVVEGDFPDGMEFSDLVFVSEAWFRTYEDSPESYLTLITVHEVAHQWWYARVGNDQALTPWLDEALATYSEYIFFEEYYPDSKDWWWQFRVNYYLPEGFDDFSVDSTVYEFETLREYINAVYLRGARMLHDLRRDVGTDAFFEWLRRYAEAGQGRIATSDLFWSMLSPAQEEATQETRARYMGDVTAPEVVESN